MMHPLLITVLATDVIAVVMLISAACTGLAVVTGWHPESTDRKQLSLESRVESASIAARFGFYALAMSTALLVFGIADLLPVGVPGAMCGTGVLQAMGDSGWQALTFRLAAIAVLFGWQVIDRLDRRSPLSPLTLPAARTLLLALPFVLMGVGDTIRASLNMNLPQVVDCCTVVYDRFRSSAEAADTAGLPDGAWTGLTLVLGTALILSALRGARRTTAARPATMRRVAVLSLLWTPVALITMVRVLAAYHYEVLHHHCPWCFFLPEHGCVGVLLYGSLSVVTLEGPTAWLSAGIGGRFPQLGQHAAGRAVSACRRLLLAVAVFALAAGLPAIAWRLRHGVWMG